jgi:energy-coupling factor transporter ATP-binding protein EcfA2
MINWFKPKYKAALEALYQNCFWAFSQEWWDAIAAAKNEATLKKLHDSLLKSIQEEPQAFPLYWILEVPREIEEAFAAKKKSNSKSLHESLKGMTQDDQELIVKELIKLWYKTNPADVPPHYLTWCKLQEVVPHGAIADLVVEVPTIKLGKQLQILLGEDNKKNPLRWIPNQETNGFALVIGASGSGKTESLKAIAHDVHSYGIPSLIIDFHGDITLDSAKALALSHTASCQYGINPLELDSLDSVNGGVFPQVQKLIESICAFNSAIGHKQKLNIEKFLFEAYEEKGISDQDVNTWLFAPPTFADVITLMEANKDAASALGVVKSVFNHPVFSKPSRIDIDSLLSQSHRVDVSALTEDIQFIVVDTLLRKIGCALTSKGHIPVNCTDAERYRFAVFIDEAHKFTSKTTSRKGIIDIYACELRKYGLMMCLGSQNLDHFSPDTISQVATKILLKLQSPESARFPANEFGLSVETITKGLRGKGHGYLKRGSADPVEFQFTPIHKR